MITNILDTRAPHLLAKARTELGGEEHPDSLIDTCVTPPRQFAELAPYESKGRQYRPRIYKTIKENGEFNPYKSENIIFFDVYMLPKRKKKFKKEEENEDEEFIDRPEIGEKIIINLRKARQKDYGSIKSFEVEVEEVWWGRLTHTDDEGFQEIRDVPTVGLILTRVKEQFERSLIMDSDFNLVKHAKVIAA